MRGLLSKEYAQQRRAAHRPRDRNDPDVRPGDPYPFQGGTNPYRALLDALADDGPRERPPTPDRAGQQDRLPTGTTSIEAADEEGWVVSVTPERRLGAGGDRRAAPASA